jgi:hypothetical protein
MVGYLAMETDRKFDPQIRNAGTPLRTTCVRRSFCCSTETRPQRAGNRLIIAHLALMAIQTERHATKKCAVPRPPSLLRPLLEAPTRLRRKSVADRSSEQVKQPVDSSTTAGDLAFYGSCISKVALMLNSVIQREKTRGQKAGHCVRILSKNSRARRAQIYSSACQSSPASNFAHPPRF